MSKLRYILEPYKGSYTRHTCPDCKKNKSFTRYIDTATGNYISEEVGRCNREVNCGYHSTPKEYFITNNISFDIKAQTALNEKACKNYKAPIPVSIIGLPVLKDSLNKDDSNNLVIYLRKLIGKERTTQLINEYSLGTSSHWPGATVFWQIDTNEKIKAGKIMLYSPTTGKRVKQPYNHITWIHKSLKLLDFNMEQCFFGEHLLKKYPKMPVAIVESEKTAMIASVYLPQFLWLACGSVTNLNERKLVVLRSRNVTLYPDLNCFEKWKLKLPLFTGITICKISNLLENKATQEEKQSGLDLADFLIRYNYMAFVTEREINIHIEDIDRIPREVYTSKKFGNIILVYIITKVGKAYDILFKSNEEPVQVGEMKNEVFNLSRYFNKPLRQIHFDGCCCWAHEIFEL